MFESGNEISFKIDSVSCVAKSRSKHNSRGVKEPGNIGYLVDTELTVITQVSLKQLL